ncbi:MAG: RNB domain-containing ribonuclease [Acidobacteriota bacterium]
MTVPAPPRSDRARLRAIAFNAMRAHGLDPDFPPDVLAGAAGLEQATRTPAAPARDLRSLLWCSIDNDDSRDLDQLSVAEARPDGSVTVMVAIADVDAAVPRGSPVDRHAEINTTSVYTPAVIFPMLPERFSTDLTSLNPDEDRLAVVIELTVARDGSIVQSDVFGALVRNQAKLAYHAVGAWLTGDGPLPPAAAAVPGMDAQLMLQDGAAQALDAVRHQRGALQFQTLEVRPTFDGDTVSDLGVETPNRAKALIENLMVASNGVVARFLDGRGLPSLRRVVRAPERWDRIVALASQIGDRLPPDPDAAALSAFLVKRRQADPIRFPDLSLTIIRLLGSGEYAVDPPGAEPPGHFGLAVKDYTHSTAPNRRYPDLVTQRLIKAAIAGRPSPYSLPDLEAVAARCTRQEDAANKVERQVRKAAAAMVIAPRVGERFDAVVTGASGKGTWVRVLTPPVEGRVVRGEAGLDVGDEVRVQLSHVDIDKGFIDFVRA